MKTSERIIAYLKLKKQVSVNELVDYLEISRMGVSKQLSNLVAENKLFKIGRPPKVFYAIKEDGEIPAKEIISDKKTNIIS